VIESTEETLLLGTDWFTKTNAELSFGSNTVKLRYLNKSITVPITHYANEDPKCIAQEDQSNFIDEDDEWEEEYEDEEIDEIPVYFTDFSYSDSDLEYNPWSDHKPPKNEPEESKENNFYETIEDEVEEENPAIYLAQAADQPEKKALNCGPLDYHQQQLFNQIMKSYADVCAKDQTNIRRTTLIKHRIITHDHTPIAQPPYRLDPVKKEFLKEEITKMEEKEIIRKSSSPWASPVVIVSKKGEDK